MTIYAQALADNRNYKNARIDGKLVGIPEARKWIAAVKAIRLPAYAIRQTRHDTMGSAEVATPIDMGRFYTALNGVLVLVGEVNGANLHAENLADEIIAQAVRIRTIDITNEMAEARYNKREAYRVMTEEETDENKAAYEAACTEVERLEAEPNNCKKIFEVQTESAFVKAVEIVLGDAITNQTMKSAEQVAAEEEARRQARRAKTAAKRAAAKAAAATTTAQA